MKKRIKKSVLLCLLLLAAFYFRQCLSLHLMPRAAAHAEGRYTLYYLVNTDGMKGLGHSILLLTDPSGAGTVLSFNGMQRSLPESLLGQSGIGKMSVGNMDAQETARFLQTGNLALDGDQLRDNYDWALYLPITEETYLLILEQARPYIEAGENFEMLYVQWAQTADTAEKEVLADTLEEMGQDQTLPLYNIYTNNCDHAARTLAAQADNELQTYNQSADCLTPCGNLKAFAKYAPQWGVMELGENSLWEKLMEFLMIF